MALSVPERDQEMIRKAWGNPERVANAALNVLYRFPEELSLDHDDQVRYALRTGVLAGEMAAATSEQFIAAFEQKILNEE